MYDEIIRRWLATIQLRQDIAQSTRHEYCRIAEHLIAWPAGPEAAATLSEYVGARRAAGTAPRTIALELRVLSVATRWAQRQLGAPPPPVMPRLRIDPRVFVLNHRTPTPAEAAAALRAMPLDDWHLAARLIAATGARVGEVLALRSVDLDRSTRRLALGASEGAAKTGVRWFPLDAATFRALGGRGGRGNASLFDFGGVVAPIQALRRRIYAACKAANVPPFTPHGLRRMVVGRLLRAQVDPATAAALTGHSITVMLKYYRDVTDEDRRAAAERAMLGVLDELPQD